MSGVSTSYFAGAFFAARWSALARWDIKSARAASFRAAYPQLVPFGSFIEEATETVRPWERADHSWPVYGVSNKSGVEFSHHQRGAEFNAPYKRIQKDWFFHNPTRANVGSLGRVGPVPEDAITSPEYQVWRIKGGLLPDFVELLISLPLFLDLVQCHRVGAVKERLFVQNLMEIPVPAFSLDQQQAIVDLWKATHKKNAAALRAADEHEAEIQSAFLAQLGIKLPAASSWRHVFALKWSDLERWGVGGLRTKLEAIDPGSGKFPASHLGRIVEMVQYGTSGKANEQEKGTAVLRMNNIQEGVIHPYPLKHVELAETERQNLVLKDGDILFNRTNSKELVGKCAVFHEEGEYVFASYLIRVRVSPILADPDFVAFILNGPIGRRQIDSMSRQIIGQANINSQELRALRIPLPPLSVQKELVAKVTAARAEIATERAAAKRLAGDTARVIEEMILGHRPVPNRL